MNTIFVQIASYRDPQLLYTLRNLFENAKHPENIFVGICWQKDENEKLFEYENHPQVKLVRMYYKKSKGACYARNALQKLYNNEKYTLQLDSHHRFIKDWDETLINMYEKLKEKGIEKPLITTYLPSFNPEKDPEERCMEAWRIIFKEKTKDKQVLFIPEKIPHFEKLTEPVPALFYSAHFAFTSGEFVKEVPHDPELYFTGEEMSITVRAYTFGYSLFHPHIVIAWHEYTRNYRTKHWDDDKEWWKLDRKSKEHYLTIFENFGEYGIGKKKTIQEYIEYSGIDFLNFDDEEKKKNSDSEEEIEYKIFDKAWRSWVEENIKRGVDRNEIKKILKKANFNPKHIDYEIKFYVRENKL